MAIDYTRRDFGTIKNDLLNRARVVFPEWTDRDPSDFGMLFVDLWSYMGDVLHYYIDRANREAFLNTATRRESVLAFANLLDYIPSGRTAAMATVTVSNSSSTDAFTIPQDTVLRGNSGDGTVTCYTTEDVIVPASGSRVLDVYEGTIIKEDSFDGALGTSNGTSSQRFSIANTDVVARSVQLYVYEDGVNKTEYRKVSSISDALFGERVFSLYTDANGVTQVLLGNNINGFVPPINARLVARYARSSGSKGNYGTNVITAFRDSVSAFINVTSSSAFVGGADEESIESLRESIPIASRTQDRAVTLQDFIDITLGVTGVYKASASYSPGASACYTSGSVTVYAVPVQSDYLTTTATSLSVGTDLKNDILEVLTPKTLLGVSVNVSNSTTLIPINIAANVYVNERYVAQWVIADVQAALSNLFSFDSVRFGQRISLSDVYRTIVDVEGVDYAEIDPKALGTFSKGNNKSTTSNQIGTGDKVFTVASGLGFVTGQTVVAYAPTNNAQASANYQNYMLGTVKTYIGNSLTISVTTTSGGSNEYTDWEIRSVSQAITAGSTELLRRGDITIYSYGGITTSV